ncbi:MAG: hypothetical protein AAGA93_13865 [Actinomycetota bacterium]
MRPQLVAADPIAGRTETETTNPETIGTDRAADDRPRGARRRSPLAVVIGLAVLTTMLLVALTIVALTDDTEAATSEADDEPTGRRQDRSTPMDQPASPLPTAPPSPT